MRGACGALPAVRRHDARRKCRNCRLAMTTDVVPLSSWLLWKQPFVHVRWPAAPRRSTPRRAGAQAEATAPQRQQHTRRAGCRRVHCGKLPALPATASDDEC